MSVVLTSNFLSNARGLTLKDGGGLAWSINKNTNEITATGSGGGVLSSVGFADNSATPIYTVGNSPLVANGTLTITFKTQSANTVLAGPASGTAAQPAFRALAALDIPALGANPSTSVGLAAVNGTATTYMRSDGAPALSVAISPTWTGSHTFSNNVLFSASIVMTHTFASWSSPHFSIDGGGFGVTFGGAIGWNGAAPPAQVTGFGTPTGASVIANFPGASATLAQCSAAIAEILTIMKAHGMIGA